MNCDVYVYDGLDYDVKDIETCIKNSGVLQIINSGDTVLLKPNFVQEKRERDDDWDYVITHPFIISAVIKLICEQKNKPSKVILADAPMTGASFLRILDHFPVSEWVELFRNSHIQFDIVDLRDEEWKMASNGIILDKKKLTGDPNGKVLCNLKDENSEFFNKPKTRQKLYGADYDIKETNDAHNGSDNYYSVSKTVIQADVIINLPKLKTHKKGGITCCLKNMIGINTNKNLLPHHTIGNTRDGGDQFADNSASTSIESKVTMIAKNAVTRFHFLTPMLVPLKRIALKVWGDNNQTARSGGWYGNDTLWRTILDLNKIMFYSDDSGSLREDKTNNRKRYIGIVDGIYGGKGNGPLDPERIDAGILICGLNPVAIDCVAAKVMGYDYKKIPQLIHAFDVQNYKLIDERYEDIKCIAETKITSICTYDKRIQGWNAADGWKGHIEEECNKSESS